MMYQVLAKYYDALVKDDEATAAWVDLIKAHMPRRYYGAGMWKW